MATWKQYNVEDIFYLRLPLDNRFVQFHYMEEV